MQQGYLFIADITGYTSYLSTTELDHARSTLQDLLTLLLEEIRSPLQVSKLEGDAVLAFTPDGAFLGGQTLIEMVEGIYGSFRRALELMSMNTTCTCRACASIDTLDLKFCVHHGEFAKQQIGQFVELVGTDVNLLHRLLKNDIVQKIGSGAYALYTEAAIDAAGIRPLAESSMTPHVESYEHIGAVPGFIQPMHEVWERRRQAHLVEVTADDALLELPFELAVPPPTAWEYVTRAETRAVFTASDTADMQIEGPRLGVGDAYVCAHGDQVLTHHIVDWQPFDYYTYRAELDGRASLSTMRLEPAGEATRVVLRARAADGENDPDFGKRIASPEFRAALERGIVALQDLIAREQNGETESGTDAVHLDVAAAVRFGLEQRQRE